MKTISAFLISFFVLNTAFTSAFAANNYCTASKKTVSQIEQLRIIELPYKIIEVQTVEALMADNCVKSRLSNEDIYTLSQMLLSFETLQFSADRIISEFLAQ